MGVEFRLLGPLEAVADGRPLALGGPKQRALLALLLLHANEVVPAERALDEIWPGADPGPAARSLQVYVSSLRKALGDSGAALQTRPGGYVLNLGEDDLDAQRFESLASEGRQALRAGEPERASSLLREALALWRGPVLADLRYEDFAQGAIGRLEELRLTAIEERIEADLSLGHQVELSAELEELVSAHPLRERFRRQLMLARYRSGRQADALAAFRDARRTLQDELGLDPGPELKELELAILRHDPALTVEPPELKARRRLPSPATALVGRRREVDEVTELVRAARLVTLTGPGGTGKTRLALQAAHKLAGDFPHGVVFVGLAGVRDPELVVGAVAAALGVPEGARPAAEALSEHLREQTLLLLVDNFEQVDAAAPALSAILAGAPGLRLLVTSRHPLRVYDEHEFPVPPLVEEEAVALFVARARAVRRDFNASAAVSELCLLLDRLPLAIELVAARVRERSPQAMLSDLPRRLDLAVAGPRDAPARHQTLWATIEWSYDLLEEPARTLFARLAVFVGGCTVEAAVAVCDDSADLVRSLVEKSLLSETGARLVMLETVREFALERLHDRGESSAVRRRHAEYFLAIVLAGKELRGDPREYEWMDRLEADRENLRAAFAFLLEHDTDEAARLAIGAFRYWYTRAHLEEGLRAFESLLERREILAPSLRPDVLTYTASLAFGNRSLVRARALAEELVELRRRLNEQGTIAKALILLGTIRTEEGDHDGGVEALEESIEIARAHGDPAVSNFALSHLIWGTVNAQLYARTRALGQEALSIMVDDTSVEGRPTVLGSLGIAALRTGDYAEAASRFAETLELFAARGDPVGMLEQIESIAAVAAVAGEPMSAARLFGAAEALEEARAIRIERLYVALREDAVTGLRTALGEAEFRAHWQAEPELTLEVAAELAAAVAARVSAAGRAGSC